MSIRRSINRMHDQGQAPSNAPQNGVPPIVAMHLDQCMHKAMGNVEPRVIMAECFFRGLMHDMSIMKATLEDQDKRIKELEGKKNLWTPNS